jgi:hypothetical protein
MHFLDEPITVAAWSKAWTVFACTNTGVVGVNPTRGMNICVHLFYVCVVLSGVLPTVYRIKKLKIGQGPTKACRAIDRFSRWKMVNIGDTYMKLHADWGKSIGYKNVDGK